MLLKLTQYERPALRERAPEFTDCLTAIHYIFRKGLGESFPLTYIGDMPRLMIQLPGWNALKIECDQAKTGDILFIKEINSNRTISHVAMIVNNNIFHCSSFYKKAVIQSKEEFFLAYKQKKLIKQLRFIDSRNTKLREEQESKYIKV